MKKRTISELSLKAFEKNLIREEKSGATIVKRIMNETDDINFYDDLYTFIHNNTYNAILFDCG